jgi:hypothetical protein
MNKYGLNIGPTTEDLRIPYLYTSRIAAAIALLVCLFAWNLSEVAASGPILEWHSVSSEFPQGFRVKVRAKSAVAIESIAIRIKIGQQTSGAYDYLEHEEGELVEGELFWRTDSRSNYIPPGTILRYNFEITDTSGQRTETEQSEFVYFDARFVDGNNNTLWDELTEGTVSVSYKGPVRKRAEEVLNTIVDTLEKMGPIMGEDAIGEPIRVTMYNNNKEMLGALPPRSATVGRELITEGQAFNEIGTLLVLGSGRLALGTASHEVMHIITHRVGHSIIRPIPPWLSEGLSEYANVDPGFSYDIALDFAIETDRLLPHLSMLTMPSKPEDVIIFYGQSRSTVRMMISQFGSYKMRELLMNHKAGKNMEEAMSVSYGFSLQELDSMWRKSIGSKPLEEITRQISRPTPIPQRQPLLYSLTPQANTEVIEDKRILELPETQPNQDDQTNTSVGCTANRTNSPFDLSSTGIFIGLIGLLIRRKRGTANIADPVIIDV